MAAQECYVVSQAGFAKVKDWWLRSDDDYLVSQLGVHANTSPNNEPPRPLNGTNIPQKFTCGPGITILKPDEDVIAKTLFDPRQIVVTF